MTLTYLASAGDRQNLVVRPRAPVDRIVVRDGRAAGVLLAGSGEEIPARTVVVAAGAYGSPAILLRSGIGPAGDLRRLGVPVVMNLPGVGRNLQDHPLCRLAFRAHDELPAPRRQVLLTARADGRRSGPPDLQIFPGGARPGAESPEICLLVGLMRPRSRGTLRLESADPGTPPRIRPGHFGDPADQRLMRTGLAMARKLAATSPLSRYLGQADDADPLPAFGSYQRPCGTCRMGRAGDPAAVTGADGQVHGVPGLFVADAAVMPRIPAANTNLPVLALAEHLSETL